MTGRTVPVNGVALIADPRTNSLIIKADADTRKEIKALAMELDTPSSGARQHPRDLPEERQRGRTWWRCWRAP